MILYGGVNRLSCHVSNELRSKQCKSKYQFCPEHVRTHPIAPSSHRPIDTNSCRYEMVRPASAMPPARPAETPPEHSAEQKSAEGQGYVYISNVTNG